MQEKKCGFSLIEVMIVLAVISILASIAIPSYNTYVLKSKISQAISIIKSYAKQYEEQYSVTGSFYAGGQINLQTFSTGDIQNVAIGSFGSGNMMYILANFRADAGFGPSARGVILRLDAVPGTNVIRHYCGQWNSAGGYVPLDYLPSSCNTTNIGSISAP